jgi:hypothetical protein
MTKTLSVWVDNEIIACWSLDQWGNDVCRTYPTTLRNLWRLSVLVETGVLVFAAGDNYPDGFFTYVYTVNREVT